MNIPLNWLCIYLYHALTWKITPAQRFQMLEITPNLTNCCNTPKRQNMLVLLRSFPSQVKQHSEDLVLNPGFLFKHHNCEKQVVEQNNPQSTRELSFGKRSPKGKGVRKVFTRQWTINRQKIFEMQYMHFTVCPFANMCRFSTGA